MDYGVAFIMGLFGSLHCVGMCGPIALSLPYQGASKASTLFNMLLYNFGRSATYMLIGIIPGVLGLGVFISGYQSKLSILLGAALLLMAIFAINPEKHLQKFNAYQRFTKWLRQQFARQLSKSGRTTFFSIGVLNGFLPCGMVYLAVAGALTQNGIVEAMLYMMFFGFGTMPLMLLLGFFGNWMGINFRGFFQKATPALLLVFGLLFFWRGLQIELPSDIGFWLTSGIQKMCGS